MNPTKLRLFELLQANETAGTIHFEHRRMLLMDADAMGLLRKELIETLGSIVQGESSPVSAMPAGIATR